MEDMYPSHKIVDARTYRHLGSLGSFIDLDGCGKGLVFELRYPLKDPVAFRA
jgi:hypothetical protein